MAQGLVNHQLSHGFVKSIFVALIDNNSILSILHELRNASRPKCDDRKASGKSLKEN